MHEAVIAGASAETPAESLPGLVSAFRFAAGGSEELAVDKPITEQPRTAGFGFTSIWPTHAHAASSRRASLCPPQRGSSSSHPMSISSSM